VNGQWWNVNENNVVPAKEMMLAASWSNLVVRFRIIWIKKRTFWQFQKRGLFESRGSGPWYESFSIGVYEWLDTSLDMN
jgi:hypothetical protein